MSLSPSVPASEPLPSENPFPPAGRNALGSDLSLWSPSLGLRIASGLGPGFAVAASVLAASPALSRGGRGSGLKSG